MADEVKQLLIEVDASVELARRRMTELARTVEQQGKNVENSLEQVDARFAGLGANLSSTVNRMRTGIGALAAVFAGIGLVSFAKDAANVALKFGQIEQAMKVATGSTAAANAEFRFIRDTADKLGVRFTTLAEQYVGLAAAARGTNLEGQATRDIFEAVARAIVATGGSAEQQTGALLAIQQIMSKGTVSAEELRGQLGERLPGAFQIASRAMGVTTAELGKMLEKGELTADVFLPRFAAQLGRELPRNVEAADAAFQRFETAVDDAKRTIASGSFMKELSSATNELAKVLREMERDGSLKEIGNLFGIIAQAAGLAAQGIGSFLRQLRGSGVVLREEGILALMGSSAQKLEAAGNPNARVALREREVREARAALQRAEQAATTGSFVERNFTTGTVPNLGQLRTELKEAEERLAAARAGMRAAFTSEMLGTPLEMPAVGGGALPPFTPGASKKTKKAPKTEAEKAREQLRALVDDQGEVAAVKRKLTEIASTPMEIEADLRELEAASGRAMEPFVQQLEEARRLSDEFADDLSRGLGQAIIYGQSLGDALVNSIKAATAELLSSELLKLLKGEGGGLGGFVSNVGSTFASVFGGGRASGGPVDPSRFYMVGEKGPELFVPNVPGAIIPNHKMGGRTEQHFHINAQGAILAQGLIAEMQAIGVRAAAGGSAMAQQQIARRSSRRLG